MEALLIRIHEGSKKNIAETLDTLRGDLVQAGWMPWLEFQLQADEFTNISWHGMQTWFKSDFLCVLCNRGITNKQLIDQLVDHYEEYVNKERKTFYTFMEEAVEFFNNQLPNWETPTRDNKSIKRTSFMDDYNKHDPLSTPRKRPKAVNQHPVKKKTPQLSFIVRGRALDFGTKNLAETIKNTIKIRKARINALRKKREQRNKEREQRERGKPNNWAESIERRKARINALKKEREQRNKAREQRKKERNKEPLSVTGRTLGTGRTRVPLRL